MYWDQKDALRSIINSLQQDKVVLASCDTVLGLFAQLSETSKLQLDAIKKRNIKPYIVLLASCDDIAQYIDQELDDYMQEIMKKYWPGPLTIIFKAKSTLPDWLQSQQGTIAIRIPEHQGWQAILQEVPGVFTTSANITDGPLPVSISDINPQIIEQVGSVCYDQNKQSYDGKPSTILDFSSGVIKIIRQGAIALDSI